MVYSPYINRSAARHDIRRAGAEARLVEDRIFLVKRLAPADDLKGFIVNDILARRPWQGMRTKGTNPTLWDTEDPQTLALLIERNHDYPSAEWLEHQSITGD